MKRFNFLAKKWKTVVNRCVWTDRKYHKTCVFSGGWVCETKLSSLESIKHTSCVWQCSSIWMRVILVVLVAVKHLLASGKSLFSYFLYFEIADDFVPNKKKSKKCSKGNLYIFMISNAEVMSIDIFKWEHGQVWRHCLTINSLAKL